MKYPLLLLAALLFANAQASAQTTWHVDVLGGPGIDFTDMSTAVATAASGDTIIIHSSIGIGVVGFTTNKGLTIVSADGNGYMTPSQIVIQDLPAGESFRMSGFSIASDAALNIDVLNCAGQVHLEKLSAFETPPFPSLDPSIEIVNSASVTLREVETFGVPSVSVTGSSVSFVHCQFGVTDIGLGGGVAIDAHFSTIDVVEPRFNASWYDGSIITTSFCDLTIAGDSNSFITTFFNGPAIAATGGTVTFDPAVELSSLAGSGASQISGSTTLSVQSVPASWTTDLHAGAAFAITTSAPAGDVLIQVIGAPSLLTATPIGTIGVDINQPYTLLPAVLGAASGVNVMPLAAPASLGTGWAFATQAVMLSPSGGIEIGLPTTVVVN